MTLKWKWYDFMGLPTAATAAAFSKNGRKEYGDHLRRGTISSLITAGLALGGLGAAGALGGAGAAAGAGAAGAAGAGAAGAGAAGAGGTAAGLGSAAAGAGTAAGASGAAGGGGLSSVLGGMQKLAPFMSMMGGGGQGQQPQYPPQSQFVPFNGGQIAALNPYQGFQQVQRSRQSPFINGPYA